MILKARITTIKLVNNDREIEQITVVMQSPVKFGLVSIHKVNERLFLEIYITISKFTVKEKFPEIFKPEICIPYQSS